MSFIEWVSEGVDRKKNWRRLKRYNNILIKDRLLKTSFLPLTLTIQKSKTILVFFHEKTESKAIPNILTDVISVYSSDTVAKADFFTKYFQSVFNQDISPTHLNVENTRTENIHLSSI